MKYAIALVVSASTAVSAQVPQAEVDRAQAAMLNRVMKAVDTYSTRIGIGHDYVTYCYNKMALDESRAPAGLLPFGADYHNMPDRYQLDTTLSVREQFERSYMTLCLADAKRTLSTAERR